MKEYAGISVVSSLHHKGVSNIHTVVCFVNDDLALYQYCLPKIAHQQLELQEILQYQDSEKKKKKNAES